MAPVPEPLALSAAYSALVSKSPVCTEIISTSGYRREKRYLITRFHHCSGFCHSLVDRHHHRLIPLELAPATAPARQLGPEAAYCLSIPGGRRQCAGFPLLPHAGAETDNQGWLGHHQLSKSVHE